MKCNCINCNHDWISRKENPNMCPKCKVKYWEKPKQNLKYKAHSFEDILNQKKYLKLIFKTIKIRRYNQKTFCKLTNLTQSQVSTCFKNLRSLNFIEPDSKYKIKLSKIFMQYLKNRYDEGKNKFKLNNHQKKIHQSKEQKREQKRKEFILANILKRKKRLGEIKFDIFEKYSIYFNDFLKKDLFGLFLILNLKNNELTLELLFDQYVKSFYQNFYDYKLNLYELNKKFSLNKGINREINELFTICKDINIPKYKSSALMQYTIT